jgi:hypothetical protein
LENCQITAPQPPSGAEWLHEIKHDGPRWGLADVEPPERDRRHRLSGSTVRYNYRPPLLAAMEGLELIPRLVFEN